MFTVLIMSEKIMSILHMAPFFVTIALTSWSFLYQKITKSRVSLDLSPTILLLSSVGIASGFGLHHNHSGEVVAACYFCFGYAGILAFVAYNLMQKAKITAKART